MEAEGSPEESAAVDAEKSAGASESIELVQRNDGDSVNLGHPPPIAEAGAPEHLEEGHAPPKMQAAPISAPKEPVSPPSKPGASPPAGTDSSDSASANPPPSDD
jgi:hypothetical protein